MDLWQFHQLETMSYFYRKYKINKVLCEYFRTT